MKPTIAQQTLIRVTLCEIERGLFYTTYPGHEREAAILELPIYGLGQDVSEIKRRIEQGLSDVGYDTVIWNECIAVPPILAPEGKPLAYCQASLAASSQSSTRATAHNPDVV